MQGGLELRDTEVRALGEGDVVIRDGWVAPEQVQRWAAAIDRLDARDRLTPAGMGREQILAPELRGDRTTWLEDADAPELAGLRAVFEPVRTGLNEAAWLGLERFSVQLAVYPGDGARYVAHRDALAGDANRRATAILYLNPAWRPAHGGRLRVCTPSGARELDPIGGRLVVFLSELVEHEVLPTQAVRRAATAWFRGPGIS